MPAIASTETVLQLNFGSHQRVTKVYCFDPIQRRVSIRLKCQWGTGDSIDTVDLDELEAIRDGKYLDIAETVRRMAREVIAE